MPLIRPMLDVMVPMGQSFNLRRVCSNAQRRYDELRTVFCKMAGWVAG